MNHFGLSIKQPLSNGARRESSRMNQRQEGFTLVEMMVALIVVGILLSIAIPNFTRQIRNNSSVSLASQLQAALNFTRTEAVKRAARVSLCPSSDGSSCASATDWAKGWMAFADSATSDSASSATVGTVLQYWGPLDQNAVVSAKVGSTAISFVRFNSTGMVARTGVTDTNPRVFNVQVRSCKGDYARTLSVGIAGLLTTTAATCQ